MAAVPPLGELDPERCYVSWEMVLATAAGRDAIRDVFIFVEDSCELTIDPDSRRDSSRTQAPRKAFRKRRPNARQTSLPELSKSSAPVREAARIYDKADNATSLRVPAAKLDQFVDLVGELVTVQARLERDCRPSRRSRCGRGLGGDRAADLGAARELDEHPHAADSRPPSRSSAAWSTTWRAIWARMSS